MRVGYYLCPIIPVQAGHSTVISIGSNIIVDMVVCFRCCLLSKLSRDPPLANNMIPIGKIAFDIRFLVTNEARPMFETNLSIWNKKRGF